MAIALDLKSASISVETLLDSPTEIRTLSVASVQRRYRWGAKEINAFWDDVLTASQQNPQASYHLGPLLIVADPQGSNTWSIIDGQQRLTTLSILISLLRNKCESLMPTSSTAEEEDELRHLADSLNRMLVRVNRRGQPDGTVLRTLQADWEVYDFYVIRRPGTTGHQQAHTRYSKANAIQPAVSRLSTLVEQHLEDGLPAGTSQAECVLGLGDFLLGHLSVLPVDSGSEIASELLFDRANSRGLPLSTSERLKAGIVSGFRNSRHAVDEFLQHWSAADAALQSITDLGLGAMDDYVRIVWMSHHGFVQGNKIDLAILEHLLGPTGKPSQKLKQNESEKRLREFGINLSAAAPDYKYMVGGPDPRSSDFDDLYDIRHRVSYTQVYPFLLAVKSSHPGEFQQALHLALSIFVRNITTGHEQSNDYEKLWPTWAKEIRGTGVDTVFSHLKFRLLDDAMFESRWSGRQIKSSGQAHFILRSIENANPYSGKTVSREDIHVEHIMAQSLGAALSADRYSPNTQTWLKEMGHSAWPLAPADKSEIQSVIHWIGNQTLWHKVPNIKHGNKPFSLKRTSYGDMEIKLTRDLKDSTTWRPIEIRKRETIIAKLAMKLWPKV
jgi:hypothetical protein